MSTPRPQRAQLPMASCRTCRSYVAALHHSARAADRRQDTSPSPRAAQPPRRPGR